MNSDKVNVRREFFAGLATYLAITHVFILNPILLSKAGINLSAGFFAVIISSFVATLLMGIWAKLPFVVAPATTLTTFLVYYVVIENGVPWQGALAAVFVSGVLCILMTYFSVRTKIIESMDGVLKIGLLFSLGSFLVANGLVQAKIIVFNNGLIKFLPFNSFQTYTGFLILLAGLGTTLLFRIRFMRLSFAPVIGIIVAALLAYSLGIKSTVGAHFSKEMFLSIGKLDFSLLLDSRVITAILIFFIVDFFGSVGKFVGLFGFIKGMGSIEEKEKMNKALYIDGVGNIVGALFGATTLSVFLSSAVGIKVGGRTGLTAIFVSLFILSSLFLFPLVGSIPPGAIAGTLIYIGCSMIPARKIFGNSKDMLGYLSVFAFLGASVISFITYSIDKSILFLFVIQTILSLRNGIQKSNITFMVITIILGLAIFLQN
ncbi:MAG: NCS2 family permease [Candidatus Pacebacteria bacterium]|nr:NCS2 family permease [Candidatus Paceibacterota bacterium]